MEQMLIVNLNVLNRRLEYEETQRDFHPGQPYVNYLAPVQRARKARNPFLARLAEQGAELVQRVEIVERQPSGDCLDCQPDCQPC